MSAQNPVPAEIGVVADEAQKPGFYKSGRFWGGILATIVTVAPTVAGLSGNPWVMGGATVLGIIAGALLRGNGAAKKDAK